MCSKFSVFATTSVVKDLNLTDLYHHHNHHYYLLIVIIIPRDKVSSVFTKLLEVFVESEPTNLSLLGFTCSYQSSFYDLDPFSRSVNSLKFACELTEYLLLLFKKNNF